MSCPLNKLLEAGHATDDEIGFLIDNSEHYINKWFGNSTKEITYNDFLEKLLNDEEFGARFYGNAYEMWSMLVDKNSKLDPVESDQRIPNKESFIPDYKYIEYISRVKKILPNGISIMEADDITPIIDASIRDSIKELASKGAFKGFRGGYDKKSWDETEARAVKMMEENPGLLDAKAIAELGMGKDDAIRYYQLQVVSAFREQRIISRKLAELKSKMDDPEADLDKLGLEEEILKTHSLIAAEWMRYTTATLSGNLTEVGRALNNAKMLRRALSYGSERMNEFIQTFGDRQVNARTSSHLDTDAGKKEFADAVDESRELLKTKRTGDDITKPIESDANTKEAEYNNKTINIYESDKTLTDYIDNIAKELGIEDKAEVRAVTAIEPKTTYDKLIARVVSRIQDATAAEQLEFRNSLIELKDALNKAVRTAGSKTYSSIDPLGPLIDLVGDRDLAIALSKSARAAYNVGARTSKELGAILAQNGLDTLKLPDGKKEFTANELAEVLLRQLSLIKFKNLIEKDKKVTARPHTINFGPAEKIPARTETKGPGQDPGKVKLLTKPTVNDVPNAKQMQLEFDDWGYIDNMQPSLNRVQIFLADHADGIRRRLWRDYKPPSEKRDPATIEMLTELGGYYYTQAKPRPKSYAEWAAHMQGGVGKFIDPEDLREAYQRMRPSAWNKANSWSGNVPLKKVLGFRREALRRVIEAVDPNKQADAIAELKDIDSSSPDAIRQYASVLEKYNGIAKQNAFDFFNDAVRIFMLAPDHTAMMNQGALAMLQDGMFMPQNALLYYLGHPNRVNRIPASIRPMAMGVYERGRNLHIGITRTLASSYKWSNKIAKIMDKTIPKDARPEALYEMWNNEIMNSGYYKQGLWDRFGLDMTSIGDLGENEEIFRGAVQDAMSSSKSAYIRTIGEIFKASERSASMYGNYMRHTTMSRLADALIADGITPDTHPKVWQETASLVNNLTGRGTLPEFMTKGEGAIHYIGMRRVLNRLLLSTKWPISQWRTGLIDPLRAVSSLFAGTIDNRVIQKIEQQTGKPFPIIRNQVLGNMIRGAHLADMPPEVARETLKRFARSMVGWSSLIGLGYQMGVVEDVELEPWASNFLKFKLTGDPTWHDILGGRQQPLHLSAVSMFHKYKDPNGRYFYTDEQGPKKLRVDDRWFKYARYRLSPGGIFAFEVYTGEDYRGRPVWRPNSQGEFDLSIAWRSLTSLSNIQAKDILEVTTNDKFTAGESSYLAIKNFLLSFFGVRVMIPD